jgi:hypothetical protein
LCAYAYGKPRNRDKLIAVEREILGDLKKMLMNSESSASEKTPKQTSVRKQKRWERIDYFGISWSLLPISFQLMMFQNASTNLALSFL